MKIKSNTFLPKIVAFAGFGAMLALFGATISKSSSFDVANINHPVTIRSGITIPSGSYGVVHLDHAKEGQLLHLRGIAGKGKLVLRSDEAGLCHVATVEFVAGDFNGRHIGIRRTGPIELAINNERLARQLWDGDEIVSDEVDVSDQKNDRIADVTLLQGLSLSQGFVIEPDLDFFDSLFNFGFSEVSCKPVAQNS